MMALIWEIFAIWMIIDVIFLVRIIKLFALAAFVIMKVNVAIWNVVKKIAIHVKLAFAVEHK